jgi:NADPH-dependent ferric siderophore reductase
MVQSQAAENGANNTGKTQIRFLSPVGRRQLEVVRIEEVTPLYRRIVLGGDDLSGGFPFQHFAPSDHVKVFFPDPETGQLTIPTITDKGWEYPEGAAAPIHRDYTVRAYDAERAELTVEFVVHEHGIAGVWARDAKVGDRVGVLGPRGNKHYPENYGQYVTAGDSTAIAAVSRLIEEAPEQAKVSAVIEVANEQELQELVVPEGIDVHWVFRDTSVVGEGHESALETVLRGIEIQDSSDVFVFAAGETNMMKPIRRYFRRELGLPKEQVDVDGYWKKGTVNLDHHATGIDED